MVKANVHTLSVIIAASTCGVYSVLAVWFSVFELGLSALRTALVISLVLLPVTLLRVLSLYLHRNNSAWYLPVVGHFVIAAGFTWFGYHIWHEMMGFYALLVFSFATGTGVAFATPTNRKTVRTSKKQSIALLVLENNASIWLIALCGGVLLTLVLSDGRLLFAALFQGVLAFCSGAVLAFFPNLILAGCKKRIRYVQDRRRHGCRRRAYRDILRACPESEASALGTTENALEHAKSIRWQLAVLLALVGTFFFGCYWISIPYMAERVYSLSIQQLAVLQLLFFSAVLVAHISVMRRKYHKQPGQSAIFSLLYLAAISFALSKLPLPFGFFCLVFFWGLNLGYALTLCWLVFRAISPAVSNSVLVFRFQAIFLIAACFGSLVSAVFMDDISAVDNFLWMFCLANAGVFVPFLFVRELWAISIDEEEFA